MCVIFENKVHFFYLQYAFCRTFAKMKRYADLILVVFAVAPRMGRVD